MRKSNKYNKIYFITIHFLVLSFAGFYSLLAQENDIKKIDLSIGEGIQLINQGNTNEALTLFYNTLEESSRLNYKKGEGYSYYYVAFIVASSKPTQSKNYVSNALNIAKEINDKTLESYSNNLLGKYYFYLHEYDSAEKHLLNAIDILRNLEKPDIEIDSLIYLYQINCFRNNYDQAIKYSNILQKKNLVIETRIWLLLDTATLCLNYGQEEKAQETLFKALELSKSTNRTEQLNRTKSLLGSLYINKEEYLKAVDILLESLEYFKKDESYLKEQGALSSQLGLAYQQLGLYTKSEANYKESLKIFQNINENDGLCGANIFLGNLYEEAGEHIRAIDCYKAGISYAEEKNDIETKQTINIRLAICNYRLGNIELAEKEIESALNYFSKSQNGYKKYQMFYDLGKFYDSIGKTSRTLDYFLLAKEIAEEIGDKDAIDSVYLELTSFYLSMGEYLKAIDYGNKLFRSAGVFKPSRININKSMLFARLCSIEGDRKKAFRNLDNALEMSKKLGNIILESHCLSALGDHYHEQLDYEKAIDCFIEALKIVDNNNLHNNEYTYLYDRLAFCYYEFKVYPTAYVYINKAININTSLRNQGSLEWEYYFLGLIELRFDRKEEAYSAFQKSIEIKDNLRIQIKEKEYKSFFTEYGSSAAIEEILSLLAEMTQESNDIELIREAFFYAEDGKARSLIDMLVEGKSNIRTSVPKEILAKLYMLYKKTDTLEKQYSMSGDKNDKRKYLDDIVSIEENIRELELESKNIDKNYAAIYYPKPIAIERVQNDILKDDQTGLLEYFLGRKYSFLFIVTNKAASFVRLNKSNIEYSTDIIKLRSNIENIKSIATVMGENSFDYSLSNRLFNDLVKPATPYLENINKIIIIPHGCLNYLPFEILISDGDNRTYLLEKYAISYAPSVSILDPGLYIGNKYQDYRGQLLALANPKYESELLTKQKGEEVNLLLPSKIRNKIDNLQYSENEVNNISILFEKSTVLKGTSATKLNFLEESPYYPIIHLATHGYLNEDKPLFSAIVFSYNNETNDVELLPAYEAFNIRLNCDLLVLSACQTGLGQEIKYLEGEGVTGLSQAFLYAGAKSIMMSLWEVEDESTSILMSEFYRNMIEKGMDKARALQCAKIVLMKKEKRVGNRIIPYYHPFFWGPFIITGKTD